MGTVSPVRHPVAHTAATHAKNQVCHVKHQVGLTTATHVTGMTGGTCQWAQSVSQTPGRSHYSHSRHRYDWGYMSMGEGSHVKHPVAHTTATHAKNQVRHRYDCGYTSQRAQPLTSNTR